MQQIVTVAKLEAMIADSRYSTDQVIGRALVALFQRQTLHERAANTTNVNNNVGFAGSDAWGGSLAAKSFIKNGKLEDWQVAEWTKRSRKGQMRICKYVRQLNEISNEKLEKVA